MKQIKKVHGLQRRKTVPPRELNLAYNPTICRMELNENTTTNLFILTSPSGIYV